MTRYRGLFLTRVPLPTAAEHRAWMHAAANLGFNRATCLRLIWARWYWRWAQGCTPARDLRRERE